MNCRSDPPGWWRDIPETSGKYQCSKGGEVRRVLKGGGASPLHPYLLGSKCHKRCKNRLHVHLRVEGKDKIWALMSVIARTWLPELPAGMVYHHANGNGFDNRVENIRPISRKELGRRTGGRSRNKCVEKIDRDGEVVALYTSTRAAARAEHMSYEAVRQRCKGLIKQPYALNGYTYRYEKE